MSFGEYIKTLNDKLFEDDLSKLVPHGFGKILHAYTNTSTKTFKQRATTGLTVILKCTVGEDIRTK